MMQQLRRSTATFFDIGWSLIRTGFLMAICITYSLPAWAQVPPECGLPVSNPVNPTRVCFVASVDHAAVTSYALDIIDPSGALVNTILMGKPVPDANDWISWDMLNVMPVRFGTYTGEVRALAGALSSVPSDPSNFWDRAPGPPGGPPRVVR